MSRLSVFHLVTHREEEYDRRNTSDNGIWRHAVSGWTVQSGRKECGLKIEI